MSHYPTKQKVYERIRWDPGLDGSWFTIGYEDRARGLQELPLLDFTPDGDIPWHRVRYIRCGDTVVWDRQTRGDVLDSLRQTSPPLLKRPVPQQFRDRTQFLQHLRAAPHGQPAWVGVFPAGDYPSFLEEVVLRELPGDGRVHLSSEWRSYAMDWMGDATHVSVTYALADLDQALAYVARRYGCGPTDFTSQPPLLPAGTPLVGGYPQPLVPVFQEAWRRLKADFAADKLLDPDLPMVRRFGGF